MNQVSELIIAKNSLVAISSSDGSDNTQSFHDQIEYLERITTNLHESVMKVRIVNEMNRQGQDRILITKISKEKARKVSKSIKFDYYEEAQIGIVGGIPEPSGNGQIVIATGGTSDYNIAEEAALTAEVYGNKVLRLYDVGVAGVHRLIANSQYLINANVVIAIAGMEGALVIQT